MRISDWSSDVCSSDLLLKQSFGITRLMFTSGHFLLLPEELYEQEKIDALFKSAFHTVGEVIINNPVKTLNARLLASLEKEERSEERRVGKECVSTGRSRR